jgi:hypothetical protein
MAKPGLGSWDRRASCAPRPANPEEANMAMQSKTTLRRRVRAQARRNAATPGAIAPEFVAPAAPDQPAPPAAREATPAPSIPEASSSPKGKLGALIALLRRPDGAQIGELMEATGWQAHSVRGAIAGAIKKKLGLVVTSDNTEAGRVYRIVEAVAGVA